VLPIIGLLGDCVLMRIRRGFKSRAIKVCDEWHNLCSSVDEPASSLEEFETAVALALMSMDAEPPSFRHARQHVDEALRICRSEPFPILDKKNTHRLSSSSSRLQDLRLEAEALRDEVLQRHRPTVFTARVAGRRYVVAASEMEGRLSFDDSEGCASRATGS
jgi:hypothetical protein